MLVKPIEWLKKAGNLRFPHRGVVVDNADPKKLGRLKVEIKNLLEGDKQFLPYVYPKNPYGLGGKDDCSGFSVPEIGSELTIVFPYENIYMGFYDGYWQSELNHQILFDEDYPNSYGFRDSTNSHWIANKTKKYTEFKHTSGTKIMINEKGDLMFVVKGGLHFDVEGEIHTKSGGNLNEDSPQIWHNSGKASPIYNKY